MALKVRDLENRLRKAETRIDLLMVEAVAWRECNLAGKIEVKCERTDG